MSLDDRSGRARPDLRTDLPTGTVTFLFTDIEGSTRLLQRAGSRYREMLEEHDLLIRSAIEAGGGTEVNTEGDAFFAVFPAAAGALHAAVVAQRALFAHRWPDGATIRVRMGLHTGEGVLGGSDYLGIDVNRAARVSSAGHGGQLLLSDNCQRALGSSLPVGVSLLDLGEHVLKGLEDPEHLYQAVISDLPAAFPPLRSEGGRPNNLPTEATLFIGREASVGEVERLLEQSRVVTLTGPGGTGKTRLAMEIGRRLLERFRHGVFLVRLESVADPDLVTTTIARTLGIVEGGERPVAETLYEQLSGRHMLLILDNFEHLTAATEQVRHLVAASDEARVLLTSRSRLRLAGEKEYPVPPLACPPIDAPTTTHAAMASEAVRLFVARAGEADHEFELSDANVESVVRIVHALDGLPLALELAAARVNLLPPRQLLDRLSDRLAVLTVGMSDAPDRHRTLRQAVAWSHDLLDPGEQALFARLGVFSGSFTLDGAEAVVAGGEVADVLGGMGSLLEKSLLRRRVELDEEVRFQMLESILAYSRDRLVARGERELMEQVHSRYFLARAMEAESGITDSSGGRWIERLSLDHDDFRAVLSRCLARGEPDTGLKIGKSLWRFWHRAGHLEEGRTWLERLLGTPGVSPEGRLAGLIALAGIVYWQGEFATARDLYEEMLDLAEQVDDEEGRVEALVSLAMLAEIRRDVAQADGYLTAVETALPRLDGTALVTAAAAVALSLLLRGNLERAHEEATGVVRLARAMGERTWSMTQALMLRAETEVSLEKFEAGWATAGEALEIAVEAGDLSTVAQALDWLGASAVGRGMPEQGLRLGGAAQAVQDRAGIGLTLRRRGQRTQREMATRMLSDDQIEQAWQEGLALSLSEALSYVRSVDSRGA